MNDTKLIFIMAYEAIDIVKNIKNNIREHFHDYLNKFVNQFFESKNLCEYANNKKEWSKEERKQFKSRI